MCHKIAGSVLHDARATPELHGSLDMRRLARRDCATCPPERLAPSAGDHTGDIHIPQLGGSSCFAFRSGKLPVGSTRTCNTSEQGDIPVTIGRRCGLLRHAGNRYLVTPGQVPAIPGKRRGFAAGCSDTHIRSNVDCYQAAYLSACFQVTPVGPRNRAKPACAGLHSALLSCAVYRDQPESRPVAEHPLEVVHGRPVDVAAHINAVP